MVLSKRQKHQEDQYHVPYHYFLEKTSYRGLMYFSYIEKCVDILKGMKNSKILDAGCGDGYFLFRIKDISPQIYGVDYSSKAVAQAKALSGVEKVFVDDISMLKTVKSETYDVVTNIAVIEHIPTELVSGVMSSLHRVLKKNGKLIMALPTKNLKQPIKHYQHFSMSDVKRLFRDFEIEAISGHHKKSLFFKFLCRCFSNPFIQVPIVYKFFLTPVYEAFYKNCSVKSATMLVVIARKR